MFEQIRKYHFEWKHLSILFMVLIFFQLIVSYINKVSLHRLIDRTQDWYKLDSAEKIANLTTTSIELLMETNPTKNEYSPEQTRDLIQAFNIIFSQQILQRNILEVCLLGEYGGKYYAIDNGQALFNFFTEIKSWDQRQNISTTRPLLCTGNWKRPCGPENKF